MFTLLQLLGLVLVVVGATLAAGVPGLLVGAGVALTYVGLSGEV
jgi:hypothetical protein